MKSSSTVGLLACCARLHASAAAIAASVARQRLRRSVMPLRQDNISGARTAVAAASSSNGSAAWWRRDGVWDDWGQDADSTLAIMSGYTDCSSQSPPLGSPQANHAWWQAHSGHHRLGGRCSYQVEEKSDKCRPPIRVPGVVGLGFCPVTKNGCTFWKSLFMRMDKNTLWNSNDIMDMHAPRTSKLVDDPKLLEVPSGLVIMVVRNPVTRTLSAWLDKRRDVQFRHLFEARPGTTSSFAKFIEWIKPEVEQGTANRHWAPQSDQCRLGAGAEYDVYLKAECRTLWGPSLFEHKGMKAWTDSGWGHSGTDPFIRDDRRRILGNSSQQVGQAPTTQTRGSLKRGHSTGANAWSKVCKYYTQTLFWDVTMMYVEDIRRFGYAEDCKRIAEHCGF